MSHHMLAAALEYLERGWSVIPLRPGTKIPLIPWGEYQQRLPTREEVQEWWGRWPDANIGIVTGRVSNLVVVDIDPKRGGMDYGHVLTQEHGLPPTPIVHTPSGGRHYYFRLPPGETVPSAVDIFPGIDIRGEGGYVVAPPSVLKEE